jgi:hypothetical protein
MNSGPFFRGRPEPEPKSSDEGHAFGATLKRIVLWPLHAAGALSHPAELDKLSEHDLQDIGLTPEDVGNTHSAGLDAQLGDAIFDERHDQIPGKRDGGRLH